MRSLFKGMSLFRKIFLGFMLTVLFASVLHLVVTASMARMGFLNLSLQERARDFILKKGTSWVDLYEKKGVRDLRKELRRLRLEKGINVVILSEEGQSLVNRAHPERVMGRIMDDRRPHGPVATEMVTSASGVKYIVTVFVTPGALPPKPHFEFFIGVYLLIFSLLGGVVSYYLARHFVRPMESLSRASRALAAGDLSVRAASEGNFSDDEIGQLARNFDSMADHIEGTITGQQRLLRDISHELRSPLTRLNLSLELLRGKTGESCAPLMGRIERESQRMNGMIGDLLSLAGKEGRFGEVKRESTSLRALLERIVMDGSFEARAQGKDVVLTNCPEQILSVDSGLISSALENLIRNGIKYTAEGTSIEVSAGALSSEELEITVEDRGPGVLDENLEAIFNPFFREDSARDRASGGVGLGLAIARRAVERHGGSIRAFNRDGGGLSVVVKIPF